MGTSSMSFCLHCQIAGKVGSLMDELSKEELWEGRGVGGDRKSSICGTCI